MTRPHQTRPPSSPPPAPRARRRRSGRVGGPHGPSPGVGTGALLLLAWSLLGCGSGEGVLASPPGPSQALVFLLPSPVTPECGAAVSVAVQLAPGGLVPATLTLALDGVDQPGVLSVLGTLATGILKSPGPGPHSLESTVETPTGVLITAEVNFEVLSTSPPQPDLPAPDILHEVLSDGVSTNLGFSVAMLPDLDGDQRAELLIGEPRATDAGVSSGRARIISGGSGLELRRHMGLAAGDLFGTSVAAAGDVDADGVDDYLVGAIDAAGSVPGGGTVTVFSGATGLVIHTLLGDEADSNFGFSVDTAGDVDQDGHADVIVGSNESDIAGILAGRVLVYSGMQGTVIYDIPGAAGTDQLGVGVAGAGDVDGDGAADFAAGAWGEDWNGPSSGSVRVWSGATGALIHRLDGDLPADHLGFSLESVGDVDGDGRPDLLVGITESDSAGLDAGAARLYSGRTGQTLLTLTGDSACDRFGISVAGAGDLNGDGVPDLIVGSLADVGPANELGTVTIFSGLDGTALRQLRGTTAPSLFGTAVAGGRDLNGDGVSDLVVGAPDSSSIFMKGGGVRTWSGLPLSLTAPGASLLLVPDMQLELAVDMGLSAAGLPFQVVFGGAGASQVGALPASGFLDADGRASVLLELAPGAPANIFFAQPSVRVDLGVPPSTGSTNTLRLTLDPF